MLGREFVYIHKMHMSHVVVCKSVCFDAVMLIFGVCKLGSLSLSLSQLLGRSIDLNALLGQRLQSNMLKAINLAISKFEASDLCSVVVRHVHLHYMCVCVCVRYVC